MGAIAMVTTSGKNAKIKDYCRKEVKNMNKNPQSLEAVHTHTHTHTITLKNKKKRGVM